MADAVVYTDTGTPTREGCLNEIQGRNPCKYFAMNHASDGEDACEGPGEETCNSLEWLAELSPPVLCSMGTFEPQVDQCVRHVVSAMLIEAEAIHLDRTGNIKRAVRKYAKCKRRLSDAIDMASSDHVGDHPKLVRHRKEISDRLSYLCGWHDGLPFLSIEDQIQPLDLDMPVYPMRDLCSTINLGDLLVAEDASSVSSLGSFTATDSSWKIIGACAALGSGALTASLAGGCAVLGGATVAAALPAGAVFASVTGAAVGAHLSSREDVVGDAARCVGSFVLEASNLASLVTSGPPDGKEAKRSASSNGVAFHPDMHAYLHHRPRRRLVLAAPSAACGAVVNYTGQDLSYAADSLAAF